ncbi:MAG: helix-turn-helix transcriptional regulator [Clostridiales bacterium]|nr:helix-turn-helix transcriptional regulator [Clostridiales bacterium]
MSSNFNRKLLKFYLEDSMIGKALKEQRLLQGLTQVELSKQTEIPQSTISAWEKGVNVPNVMDCIQLADFYGISLDELVGREVKEK